MSSLQELCVSNCLFVLFELEFYNLALLLIRFFFFFNPKVLIFLLFLRENMCC